MRDSFSGQKNEGGRCECSDATVTSMRTGKSFQLPGCGRAFGGLTGFDRHRIKTSRAAVDVEYDSRCATDAELTADGFHQDERGVWRQATDGFDWASEAV